jgi:hypothetical protein
MATLREALEQSPVGKASNEEKAWEFGSIVSAHWLPDGRVMVTADKEEGDRQEMTYDTPEEANLALFTEKSMEWDVKQNAAVPVTLTWDGANEWQAEAK